MQVNIDNNTISITLNKNVLKDEIVDILEYIKIKELLYKSELTKEDVFELDEEIKSNWWEKNKDKIMEKINGSC
jgi:hypothetical protein